MAAVLNGVSIRDLNRYEAIEAGLAVQARYYALKELVFDLAHPADGPTYKKAVEMADDIINQ